MAPRTQGTAGEGAAAEPQGDELARLRAENARLAEQLNDLQAEKDADARRKQAAHDKAMAEAGDFNKLPKTVMVKVRPLNSMMVGTNPKDTRIRYGAGLNGIKEDPPIALPLCRIYKRPLRDKNGDLVMDPVQAARNLVTADGKDLPDLPAIHAERVHAEWEAELAKIPTPQGVEEQGRIFSSPKREVVTS
jgi:hypothetical protein